ncbi:ALP1-like protein isoform X1 [Tanacetum coccineum]
MASRPLFTLDAFDEYLQIVERTSRECLDHFTKCIHVLYYDKFLRRPTATDIQKTYELHEEKHGLPGMLGSIDCMHWDWKNRPKSLHGQFKRSTNKYPTLMLEVVANQKLWIWHAYFGAPECPFVVNGHTYRKCYYLADGIYPVWSTFVKTFSVTRDEKTLKFKSVQKAARKDIERAFGNEGFEVSILERCYCFVVRESITRTNCRDVRDWVKRCYLHVRKTKELRDRKTHTDLRQDLMEHLWNNDDE